jgi:hypothetical protein
VYPSPPRPGSTITPAAVHLTKQTVQVLALLCWPALPRQLSLLYHMLLLPPKQIYTTAGHELVNTAVFVTSASWLPNLLLRKGTCSQLHSANSAMVQLQIAELRTHRHENILVLVCFQP